MPHAEARIQTPHPSRYLVQLCQHAQKFSHKLRHLHDHHLERPAIDGQRSLRVVGRVGQR